MAAMELSLRRYVTLSLLLMMTAVIGTFSYLSAKQFLAGVDGMLRGSMIDTARRTAIEPGETLKVLSYTITTEWQNLPAEIKASFDEQDIAPFQLAKDVSRASIFHRPHEAKFVLLAHFDDRVPMYVAQHFQDREHRNHQRPPFRITREAWVMILGIVTLLIFSALVLLVIKTVAKPVEVLSQWAAGLNDHDHIEPPPQFRYAELNGLASLVYRGMRSVKHSVEREKEFVGHASHELRTPIAVIHSSMELINRVRKDQLPDKLNKPLQRIENASHTMADLTETLLWLAKTDRNELNKTSIALDSLVTLLVTDLGYLTQGKTVKVFVDTEAFSFQENQTAVRIVAGNLIRNAFQHTLDGQVVITQRGATLEIVNSEFETVDETAQQKSLGFGLGLKMIEQLTRAMGWAYTVDSEHPQNYRVIVNFERC